MGLFKAEDEVRKRTLEAGYPKTDAGIGHRDDYDIDFRPKKSGVVLGLAGSDAYQAELEPLAGLEEGEVTAFVGRRSADDERTDAPTHVRMFANGRPTGVVGIAPRGLEPALEAAVARLEELGRSPRLPARIVRTKKNGLRVEILIGETR